MPRLLPPPPLLFPREPAVGIVGVRREIGIPIGVGPEKISHAKQAEPTARHFAMVR